jgi:hypothetical protein
VSLKAGSLRTGLCTGSILTMLSCWPFRFAKLVQECKTLGQSCLSLDSSPLVVAPIMALRLSTQPNMQSTSTLHTN